MTEFKIKPGKFAYHHLRNRRIVIENCGKRTVYIQTAEMGVDFLIQIGTKK